MSLILILCLVSMLGLGLLGTVLLKRHASTSPDKRADAAKPAALPTFTDEAQRAGLTFRFDNGHKGIATILEESGPGCALLDYDGDGWLDIYLLNGRDLYGRGRQARNALYHNNGDGTFTDVTEKAGVPGTGYGIGVAVGDYDNDGHPDIYISQWGKNCLYHNNGDGTFTDVTERAGVGGQEYGGSFHTGAAWIDYDHDGKLDLFACGYVRFRQDGLRYCKLPSGALSNCPPAVYEGTPSLLYHNNGDGTFTNVTKQAKVYFPGGKALSALTCDVDDDGWTDLIVGNDGEEAWLLRNNHDGTFTNRAAAAGIAFAQDGATMAAMGIDLGDYMNEGRPGFFVADFSKRPDHLWRAQEGGFFSEVSTPSGIADPTFNYLGFGAGFFDYDNDGWLDLFIANGHVYPEVEQPGTDEHYLQNNQLFRNQRNGTYIETTAQAGPAFQLKHASRGAAFGDCDNDGNLDILVSTNDGPPLLLHNSGAPGTHFVNFKLVGTKSNRDAVGARVRLTAGGLTQMRDVKNGGSYLSSSDPRLHFGLGRAAAIDRLEVRWPSGLRQTFGPLPADGIYLLREGAPTPELQTFQPPRPGGRQ
jgi:hypothetical protein